MLDVYGSVSGDERWRGSLRGGDESGDGGGGRCGKVRIKETRNDHFIAEKELNKVKKRG